MNSFTRAADIDPNNVDAYQNAGLVLEQMGALDAAKQAFAEALKRDPTRAVPRQHLQRLKDHSPADNVYPAKRAVHVAADAVHDVRRMAVAKMGHFHLQRLAE